MKFSKSLQWSSLSKQIDNTKIDKKRIVIDAIKKFNLQNNRWPTTNEIVADNKNINKSFFRGNKKKIIKFLRNIKL